MSQVTFDRELAAAIGFRVVRRRVLLGLSQRDIARKAGCTDGTICSIETGHGVPGGRVIVGLCRALEMTPSELFGWDGDEP